MMGIEDAISYCPETGLFRWKIQSARRRPAGSVAGFKSRDGYWTITFNYRGYRAHRIAWYLMTGEWPKALIDHRNLDRTDNRWDNLREATPAQNSWNVPGRGLLPKGVTFNKGAGRFQAQIKVAGKNHYLGLFDSADEAHDAYVAAAANHFGEFARAA